MLCLNLIVKNEAAVVRRLLASVSPYLSYYVICDTGSEDETLGLILQCFGEHGVEGEVHEFAFEDFSQARNQALEKARASSGKFEYFLLADADMELIVEDPHAFQQLDQPAYRLRQVSGNLGYENLRLLRRDVAAHYVGYTHEYLKVDGPVSRLQGAYFKDYADGANRPEKFQRDTALLLRQLEQQPEDGRAMFYLAETCRGAGRWQEAAAWHQLRIQTGGFDEEVWYSQYQLAACHLALGDERRFLAESLMAYQMRPWPNEPLLALARHYQARGMAEAAGHFAEAAADVPYPQQDVLFIEEDAYSVRARSQLSRAARNSHLAARRKRGQEACWGLLRDPQVAAPMVDRALQDWLSYPRRATDLLEGAQIEAVESCIPGAYHPSLALHKGRLFCTLRTSNYDYIDHRFVSRDPDGVFRTRNYFCQLDDHYRVLTATEMDDRFLEPALGGRVRGFEDCRLFRWRNRWWCSSTCLDRNPAFRNRVALFQVAESGRLGRLQNLPALHKDHEKNWVPLVRDDQLYWIYTSSGPLRILNERLETSHQQATPTFLGELRGSTPAWARAGGGWLTVARHAVFGDGGERHYLHRWLCFDSDFQLLACSDPFCFFAPGVECAMGLTMHPNQRQLLLSFGRNECEAYVLSVEASSVERSLWRTW